MTICLSKVSMNVSTTVRLGAFKGCTVHIPQNGLKNYILPPSYDSVEYPERLKLKFVNKVPIFPAGLRPPKMQKNLRFMRGPEEVHNKLIHKQYGIIAQMPGRLRYGHFEMIRNTVGRRLDLSRMFAIWRIDDPWQPVTKKGQGKRMGGGKGAIDHYVTPVKHGRVIIELGGHCEYSEAYPILKEVIGKLPFKAKAVSNDILEKMHQDEIDNEKNNINPYTLEYVIKNNMARTHLWISPYDRKWFNKHM